MIKIFIGDSAFSSFRLEKKLKTLQQSEVQLKKIKAHSIYLVELEDELSQLESEKLLRLLPGVDAQHKEPVSAIYVTPRVGTVSPWSSKATDIMQRGGLTKIKRIEHGIVYLFEPELNLAKNDSQEILSHLYDPLTESIFSNKEQLNQLFEHQSSKPVQVVPLLEQGRDALVEANNNWGLALSAEEIDYLTAQYQSLNRNPTDAELMMFGQVNSEHCRHKIFNAKWSIDGRQENQSLFQMIKNTHKSSPKGTLIAYEDNGAVLEGYKGARFFATPEHHQYQYKIEDIHLVIKVETHNHPTAVSPFAGSATGSGGEIRDEGATGRGAKPIAGLCGFSVSNLHIPGFAQPWEFVTGKPEHHASALQIMLEAPMGAASFNNEFGRPNLCGYFRSYEMNVCTPEGTAVRGYHKPIMIAGGMGHIRSEQVHKESIPVDAKLIVLGGPAMLIGLGGGAVSSMAAGTAAAELDFASVQRSNPEMQRRCQQVIDSCWALGGKNPILSIHDVGAGGLSNAFPELVHQNDRGGFFDLRDIPAADTSLSPMEIWCNEAQERYVLAVNSDDLTVFKAIAERERCPFAVVGEATNKPDLIVRDGQFNNSPVDIPLEVLFPKTAPMHRDVHHATEKHPVLDTQNLSLAELAKRILQLPTVADKSFLITIGDRTVTGLVHRDQMVGPWQVPVADVAVTLASFEGYTGQAMAMGERTPIALIHQAASARMAIGEAITNIAAAPIENISDIKLSANWMAAAGYPGEDAGLFDAVQAVGLELCPALGISIPVGKDSLSMRTVWRDQFGQHKSVVAPLSLIISAFAPVRDVRQTLTPQLITDQGETNLILIDLGEGCHALGGSALAQVLQQVGHDAPDVDDPSLLQRFFKAIQQLNREQLLLAYHDRSDGGLFVTLCEMAFAGQTGITVDLKSFGENSIAGLFNEELGAVIQVRRSDTDKVLARLKEYQLHHCSTVLGELNDRKQIEFLLNDKVILAESLVNYHRLWSATSYQMQSLRDNPECAQQAYDNLLNNEPGLNVHLTFDQNENIAAPYIAKGIRPKVAILREQGVNGHVEMAAAFDRAGFTAVDVHMSDLENGRINLAEFKGIAACGGFSYGDVLGAGQGWAKSILFNDALREQFSQFFGRLDTFALGICNGCQMLAHLQEIIPGSEGWPIFVRNQSEQFEARLSLIQIPRSTSIFFQGMEDSQFCIPVAHGEGHALFKHEKDAKHLLAENLVPMRYVDQRGEITQRYPHNPSGTPLGIAGVTSRDGRVTLLMPHPERGFRAVQNSWHPKEWLEDAPTMRMFRNARVWVG